MHYPIEYEYHQLSHEHSTRRQRHPRAQLIHLYQGKLHIQLGRQYLELAEGQSFWLPANSLHALHIQAGTQFAVSAFSIRVRASLPKQAGQLPADPLLIALLNKLAEPEKSKSWQGEHGRLLQVLADQLGQIDVMQKQK